MFGFKAPGLHWTCIPEPSISGRENTVSNVPSPCGSASSPTPRAVGCVFRFQSEALPAGVWSCLISSARAHLDGWFNELA